MNVAGVDRQDVTQHGPPRPFWLLRSSSGATSTVGEGVEWADGFAVVRWSGQWPSVSVWEGGITAFLTAHGCDDTEVRWLDCPAPPAPMSDRHAGAGAAAGPDGRCRGCGGPWPCLTCEGSSCHETKR